MTGKDVDASAVHDGALKAAEVLGLDKDEAELFAQELLGYPFSIGIVLAHGGVPHEYKMVKHIDGMQISFTVEVKDVSTDGDIVAMSSYISSVRIHPVPGEKHIDYFGLNQKLEQAVGVDEL